MTGTKTQHGSPSRYKYGCRCDECREAHSAAHLAYIRRRRALPPVNTCTTADCERDIAARGLCSMHYKRWVRANGRDTAPSSRWTDGRRNNYHLRRARLAGATNGDKVILGDVIKRDGTNCAGCGEPVDLSLTWPHRMSKSLDHIVPVSKGGRHEIDNAALMHFACNASKGARV
jgi:5-methylcytosine-specific restriction endonuclease McrA